MTEQPQDGPPQIRRIVIFADGTGNAFSTQESNVWRLYRALDLSDARGGTRQIARYIRGVGTSGFRPLAALDAATGFGVPGNVRKLYRFICWNWRPGDEIWMFGFSRGAFTVRTLAGLIASQGLVPARFGTEPVPRVEMERNAMAAWRAYRAASARWYRSSPLVWIGRLVRDVWLAAYHGALGHRSYGAVRAEMDRQAGEGEDRRGVPKGTASGTPVAVPVAFLGLFDTVEAFGVPFEEMRRAIDWAIWPISFRNRRLSPCVRCARHALALDDERTSFHPVRFDAREPGTAERVSEVWFAGVHSDVGGGYPDGELSFVPLVWMAREAQRAATGLRFHDGEVERFASVASAFGTLHDSRAGLAVAYRYDPRTVEGRHALRPVVHRSVLTKMVLGSERYAPVMLPEDADVLIDDGRQRTAVAGEAMRAPLSEESRGHAGRPLPDLAGAERLPVPNAGFIALTRDAVWWRRVAYFLLLVAAVAVLALPWTADALTEALHSAVANAAGKVGLSAAWEHLWGALVGVNDTLGGTLDAASKPASGLVPSYLVAYVDVLTRRPLTSLVVLLAAFGAYRLNANLRDFIADKARCAWFADAVPGGGPPAVGSEPERGPAMRMARFVRERSPIAGAHRLVTRYAVPALIVAAMTAGAAVAVSRATVLVRTERGTYCRSDPSRPKTTLDESGTPRTLSFETDDPCSPTAIVVEKGRHYVVRITMADPYRDGSETGGVVTGVRGFTSRRWPFLLGLPLRRRLDADWFQPVARIGLAGGTEFPLSPLDGVPAPAAGTPVPQRDAMVAEFVAERGGELFLYVNDALVGVPFLCACTGFYADNHGRAEIGVTKVPLPGLDPPAAP